MICKSCNSTLIPSAKFCNDCGGKVIQNRLTLKNLFEDSIQRVFNYDNRLLQTFIKLFTKPEDVIGSYINGSRKKYTDAVSYFAIALTIAGLQMFILNKFFPSALDFSGFTFNEQQQAVAAQNKIKNFTIEYQSLIMMFYIPMYALMSKITFFNFKKYNYTEHLVIFLYVQAQITIVSFFYLFAMMSIGISFSTLTFYMFPLMVIYSAYCLKRLHGLSLKGIIYKFLFFILIFSVTFIIFSIAASIIYYLAGGYDELIEATKAKKALQGS